MGFGSSDDGSKLCLKHQLRVAVELGRQGSRDNEEVLAGRYRRSTAWQHSVDGCLPVTLNQPKNTAGDGVTLSPAVFKGRKTESLRRLAKAVRLE